MSLVGTEVIVIHCCGAETASRPARMVTLTWSDALAVMLPGVLLVIGLARLSVDSWVAQLLSDPSKLSVTDAGAIVVASALAGGVLDGGRRVFLDFLLPKAMTWLRVHMHSSASKPPPRDDDPEPGGIYGYVTPDNLPLFEFLVQQSYKYYTFYGNLCLSIGLLLIARRWARSFNAIDLLLFGALVTSAIAAWIQQGYFTQAMAGFVEVERKRRSGGEHDVQKLATTGHPDANNPGSRG